MKKLLMVLPAALAMAMTPVFAQEPIGLDIGLEIGTGDVLAENADFFFYALPSVDYTVLATGIAVGISWNVPITPDALQGEDYFLEVYIEYGTSALGFEFTLGDDNTYFLDGNVFENQLNGYLYGAAGYALPHGLGAEVELDFTYVDPSEISSLAAILTGTWEMALGPGKIGAEIALNFVLWEEDGEAQLGDTELAVRYTMPAGPVELTFELEPTYTTSLDGPDLTLDALVSITYSI